jgi:hypothetical protein
MLTNPHSAHYESIRNPDGTYIFNNNLIDKWEKHKQQLKETEVKCPPSKTIFKNKNNNKLYIVLVSNNSYDNKKCNNIYVKELKNDLSTEQLTNIQTNMKDTYSDDIRLIEKAIVIQEFKKVSKIKYKSLTLQERLLYNGKLTIFNKYEEEGIQAINEYKQFINIQPNIKDYIIFF